VDDFQDQESGRGVDMTTETIQVAQLARAARNREASMPEQLSAVVAGLDKLSRDQLHASDREQLLKFMELCRRWRMLAEYELYLRATV
jgi:hypothetical protein